MVTMTLTTVALRERIMDSMLELAHCCKFHRILVAGSSAPDLMLSLHCRGYGRVSTLATCGLPHGQYSVALIDWRGRSIKALESTLNWLVGALCEQGFAISATRRDAPPMAIAA